MSDTGVGKGFVVYFSQLETWSVAAQLVSKWNWPKEAIHPLAKVLARRSESALDELMPDSVVTLLTLRFNGSIEPREPVKIKDVKGKLFRVYPGDVVFSKIDVRNGAIGLAPSDIECMCVTSEYPVYSVNSEVSRSEYIKLLFRTAAFRQRLNSMISGASGRKRIQPSQLEGVKVPVPSLSIQEKIISYWDKLQSRLDKSANSIQKIEKILEVDLLEKIGIRVPPVVERKGGFLIRFIQTERWDTFFFREDFISIESQIISVDHVAIGDALNFVSRRWSKANSESDEFDYIEISSVNKVDGITSTKRVKVKEAPSRATTEVKGGDVIISTTRPNLGAFTVVDKKYEGSVCSSGFALADGVKTDRITKEFVLFFLKSPAGLRQIERRMSGGLYPAIIHSELEKVLIPLPSLNVQRKIVQEYQAGIGKIKKLQQETARDREKTLEDIDQMILGTLPVEE